MITQKRLQQITLAQIVYLLLVILFGAYVRASGSGAGCGNHWPLCNGEIIPTEPVVQTIIEFTHRITSGLCLLLAAFIYFMTRRLVTKGHQLRLLAGLTLFFVITEGLVGAGLVYFEHVASNQSVYRGLSMTLHLINTFSLVACATATHLWSYDLQQRYWNQNFKLFITFIAGLTSLLVLGMSGSITALGDTIFPVADSSEAWLRSFTPTEHLFVRLRIYHPFIAMFSSIILLTTLAMTSLHKPQLKSWCSVLLSLVLTQLLLGYINVQLLAPTSIQLLHLLLAELIWIGFISLAIKALMSTKASQAY